MNNGRRVRKGKPRALRGVGKQAEAHLMDSATTVWYHLYKGFKHKEFCEGFNNLYICSNNAYTQLPKFRIVVRWRRV